LLCALRDHDDAVGIAKGQRAQKDGVKDAEDGGVTTDAEGERQDCDGSEDLGATQLANGKLEISKQIQDYLACGAAAEFGMTSHRRRVE
jgi:hypothetical protein